MNQIVCVPDPPPHGERIAEPFLAYTDDHKVLLAMEAYVTGRGPDGRAAIMITRKVDMTPQVFYIMRQLLAKVTQP